MTRIVKESLFFAAAASVIILPTPTLVFAWVTGKTITEILYR